MEKTIAAFEVIVPIFFAMFLGVLARKRQFLSPEQAGGLQQFVLRIALPFVLFNSCLLGDFGRENLLSMALVVPLLFIGAASAFRVRRRVGYSNLPMAFAAGEAGMLGIPLYLMLFGQDHIFQFSAIQIGQAAVVVPVISILQAEAQNQGLRTVDLVKKVLQSPLLLGSLFGLAVNLSGGMQLLRRLGVDGILTETTDFITTPISAIILFVIGYTFVISGKGLRDVFRVGVIRLAVFSLFCLLMQGVLFLVPDVAAETRWAVALYCLLPAPFLMPGLGKNQEEYAFGAGLCSLGTVITMAAFCVMTVLTR